MEEDCYYDSTLCVSGLRIERGAALSLVIAIMSVMHARIGHKKGEFC